MKLSAYAYLCSEIALRADSEAVTRIAREAVMRVAPKVGFRIGRHVERVAVERPSRRLIEPFALFEHATPPLCGRRGRSDPQKVWPPPRAMLESTPSRRMS